MGLDSIFIISGVNKAKINNEDDVNKLLNKYNVSANYFQNELTW